MKYVLAQKTYEAEEISAPGFSESIDVGSLGGDSIAYVMNASEDDTPVSATIALQGSIDDSVFFTIGSAVSVPNDGNYGVGTVDPLYRYYRVAYAIDTGSYVSTLQVLVKGDKAG